MVGPGSLLSILRLNCKRESSQAGEDHKDAEDGPVHSQDLK